MSASAPRGKKKATVPDTTPPVQGMQALSVSFDPSAQSLLEELRLAREALQEERAARLQAERRQQEEHVARLQAERRQQEEHVARLQAEHIVAAQNLSVRECIRAPDARMFESALHPVWGEKLVGSTSRKSTTGKPKWFNMSKEVVSTWEEADFVSFLQSADHLMVTDDQGRELNVLELVLNGKTTPDVAAILRGRGQPLDESYFKAEATVENLLVETVWWALKGILGNKLEDQERYPIARYLWTRVSSASQPIDVIKVPPQYHGFFEFDRVIESRFRSDGVPPKLDDFLKATPDQESNYREIAKRCVNIIVEIKPDVLCPKKKDETVSRDPELVLKNQCLGGNLVDYIHSKFFDPYFNPVSQVVTYAVLMRTRPVAICTGNVMTYGWVTIPQSSVKPQVQLTKKFQWTTTGAQLALRPEWSQWEILIRFVLASFGKWHTGAFPDAFKNKFTRRLGNKSTNPGSDGGGDGDNDDGSVFIPYKKGSAETKGKGGGGGGGGVQSMAFALSPLVWADLWSPIRFAVPATHSVEVECTQEHLEGDAELLAEGRMGCTYRQTLQGRDVVVKTLPFACKREVDGEYNIYPLQLREEMRHEFEVYQRLTSVQGVLVPRLLWYGEIVEGLADALVTEYSGESLDDNSVLTEERALAAIRTLNGLHSQGVLHGDVALRNFVVLNDTVKAIDFGFARFRENVLHWTRATQKEHDKLLQALGSFAKSAPKVAEMSLPVAVESGRLVRHEGGSDDASCLLVSLQKG